MGFVLNTQRFEDVQGQNAGGKKTKQKNTTTLAIVRNSNRICKQSHKLLSPSVK